MSVLPACIFVHHMCSRYPRVPEDGIRSPGAGVTDGRRQTFGGAEDALTYWAISQCLILYLIFYFRVSHWTWSSSLELNCLASKHQRTTCSIYHSSAGWQMCADKLGFFVLMVTENPNSGIHASKASPLIAEPSPQSMFWHFYTIIYVCLKGY